MARSMRRVAITGVGLVTPNSGPSIEDMFVATTQAADETEGAMCLMSASAREESGASLGGPAEALREGGPDGVDGPPEGGPHRQASVLEGRSHTPSYVASGFSRTENGRGTANG